MNDDESVDDAAPSDGGDGGGEDILLLEAGLGDTGQRLDSWLAAQCPDLSRTRLKQLILQGAVLLKGVPVSNPSQRIKSGMAFTVIVPPPLDDTPVAEDIPLDIVYEDDDLLVINKPAGLVVHPAPGHRSGTLVNALLFHCGDTLSGIGGVRRPGIVHRLDKETTGLMLVAKNDRAHAGLSAQLADRTLSRQYRALVWGVPTPKRGRVQESLGRHPTNRQKMAVVARNGRDSATQYEVSEVYGAAASLLICKLETGRTHQVRVHMSHIGHQLVGDPMYGRQRTGGGSLLRKDRYSDAATAAILAFSRQALHAWQIKFIHPGTGEAMSFEAGVPDDFETLISHFKSNT